MLTVLPLVVGLQGATIVDQAVTISPAEDSDRTATSAVPIIPNDPYPPEPVVRGLDPLMCVICQITLVRIFNCMMASDAVQLISCLIELMCVPHCAVCSHYCNKQSTGCAFQHASEGFCVGKQCYSQG